MSINQKNIAYMVGSGLVFIFIVLPNHIFVYFHEVLFLTETGMARLMIGGCDLWVWLSVCV